MGKHGAQQNRPVPLLKVPATSRLLAIAHFGTIRLQVRSRADTAGVSGRKANLLHPHPGDIGPVPAPCLDANAHCRAAKLNCRRCKRCLSLDAQDADQAVRAGLTTSAPAQWQRSGNARGLKRKMHDAHRRCHDCETLRPMKFRCCQSRWEEWLGECTVAVSRFLGEDVMSSKFTSARSHSDAANMHANDLFKKLSALLQRSMLSRRTNRTCELSAHFAFFLGSARPRAPDGLHPLEAGHLERPLMSF